MTNYTKILRKCRHSSKNPHSPFPRPARREQTISKSIPLPSPQKTFAKSPPLRYNPRDQAAKAAAENLEELAQKLTEDQDQSESDEDRYLGGAVKFRVKSMGKRPLSRIS